MNLPASATVINSPHAWLRQTSLVCEQNFLHLHFLCVGILFNSTALGIHFCETSLIFNFKTRLGGNMHKGYSKKENFYLQELGKYG